jgi:hypothetical protein
MKKYKSLETPNGAPDFGGPGATHPTHPQFARPYSAAIFTSSLTVKRDHPFLMINTMFCWM